MFKNPTVVSGLAARTDVDANEPDEKSEPPSFRPLFDMDLDCRVHVQNLLCLNLQEYTERCQNELTQILAADYGSDLPSVQGEFENHQQEHRVIDKFHSVLHYEIQQANFSADESNLYQQRFSQLLKVYAELLSTSTKQLSDLDALQNFLAAANAELQWLNDREQVEVSIHRYYENLMSELKNREMHFDSILDRGEALLLLKHPAAKCIEAHLQALQSQWSYLLKLTLCLEVHLKHDTEYHTFFAEIKDADLWLAKRDEIRNISVALWQKNQLRLRKNMIFATIKDVGWEFDQFLAMGAEQRTAIRRAINDDADKLLSEGDPADPQLRRLRREMDEVHRLFNDFGKREVAEQLQAAIQRLPCCKLTLNRRFTGFMHFTDTFDLPLDGTLE